MTRAGSAPHPLAIVLALTAGTILSGIIGALLAGPITTVARAAITEWQAPDGVGRTGHDVVTTGRAAGVRH